MGVGYVFFDLGLTLLDNNHVPLFKKALKANGVDLSLTDVHKAYHLANKTFMRTRPGEISDRSHFNDYVALFLVFAGLDEKAYLDPVSSSLHDLGHEVRWMKYPFTDDVVSSLKGMGIRTGLISNWDRGCRRLLDANGLSAQFDPLIISSEVGMEKPDKRIFELALEKSGADPDECLYVGDNYYDDVLGASRAGIRTILINSPGRLGIEETGYDFVAEDIRGIMRYI